MNIVVNEHLNELEQIFNENNQNYVSDKACIFDNRFEKLVAIENNIAIGYITIYVGDDFIEKEEYPINLELKKNTVYIWNMVTRKGYENKGIGTALLNAVTRKYRKYDIYNVIDVSNIPSLRIAKKVGFKDVLNFSKEYDGQMEHYLLLKINGNEKEQINEI